MLENIPQVLAILGLIVLSVEIAVLGFSTFVLLFIGIAILLTSGVMYLGVIEANWINAVTSVALVSFVLALVLWKPLKRMQNRTVTTDINSDFAVITFTLDSDISPSQPGSYQYSGITWQVKSLTAIPNGTPVTVVKKEVGVFWVKPIDETHH
ncbi:NfeD family protein [Vibrio sp. SM6]|uniref:NfeD family protein n=1 Tax=Vibrio agarilyticus TaxID=2726741 RepID=A0A7X8TTI6_9VIBR|nr:NfeD family protein [Vibrio agarilyticus]NLS14541.1 NfeD family protein [Vibrio agarilyticus]